MNQRYPAKRDNLFGWLSELSDLEGFPRGMGHEESNLSVYEDDAYV